MPPALPPISTSCSVPLNSPHPSPPSLSPSRDRPSESLAAGSSLTVTDRIRAPPRNPRSRIDGSQGGEEAGGEEARGGGGARGREGPGGEEAQGGEAPPGGQVGRQGRRRQEGEEEGQEVGGDLQDLHLQGAQAGAP